MNHRRKAFTVLVFLFALSLMISVANARVDLLTSAFESEWIDLDQNGVQLTRTYSSRSTHNGIFGYGWCSPLEAEIILPNLALQECDRRTQLTLGQSVQRIDDTYVVRGSGKSLRVFDGASGRLVQIGFPTGKSLNLEYDRGGLLQDAATGEGLKMRFRFDAQARKVRRIELSTGTNLEFDYQGLDLTRALNSWTNTYRFTYDSLHNLTQISYPDQSSEDIVYNTDRDQAVLFRGRNGCRENYNYANPLPQRMISEATKYCDGRDPEHLKLEIETDRIIFTRNGVMKEYAR
ncbi:MAG TPA: DUF6531 domain-containing protein [Bdellovibrionales bacterium]|nr:DUF6531 domain-containing protein [Bdellovibrionales bacterium]